MLDNKGYNAQPQDEPLAEKSDLALVDRIKGAADPAERNQAFAVLQTRYEERLHRYLHRKLPADWVAPTKQQIWQDFSVYLLTRPITKGVPNLLMTIARNQRADAAKQLKREREIEMDDPVEEAAHWARAPDLEEQLAHEAEEQLGVQQFRVFYQHTFMDFQLTGCQRVLLELRRLHKYRSKSVGRLLGKHVRTIDTQINYANQWVNNYFTSDAFHMAMAAHSLSPLWQTEAVSPSTLVIDRFSQKVMPQFTTEELKPLSMTMRELERHFAFSLMFPRSFDDDATSLTPPFLLLTRKADQRYLNRLYHHLRRNPASLPDELPVEALIRIDVEDDNFVLRVDPLVQIFPDPDRLLAADQYMLVHKPRLKVSIVLATYDDELSGFTGDRRVWRKLYNA